MQLKVKYRKDKKTISFMRLYCSSSLHKKGYCVRKHRGINLQSVTQIVVSDLNKKVKNIVSCEDVSELLEKYYKDKDNTEDERELKETMKQLEKTNKMVSSLYLDYKNGVIQEVDFKTMYNQEIAKRDNLNEKIDKINNKTNNNMKISDNQFKKVAKKVSNVKNWSKEQLADVIESVEIDNNDNIYINYKYDILVIA